MIEFLGVAGRVALLLGVIGALGCSGFLSLTSSLSRVPVLRWQRAWFMRMGVFPVLAILGLLLQLLAQAMTLTGTNLEVALSSAVLEPLLQRTNFGHVWTTRLIAVSGMWGLWAATLLLKKDGKRASWLLYGLLAAVAAGVGPIAGHSAGAEIPALLMSANAVHILAAGLWAGALPCWISWAHLHRQTSPQDTGLGAVQRFSRVAATCVLVLVLTGLLLTNEFVETAGDLLGTQYGLLIVGKVVFLAAGLLYANRVRKLLVADETTVSPAAFFLRALPAVRGENLALLIVVVLAGTVAQTTPASHDQAFWVLPFRISLESAWDAWPDALYGGLCALVVLLTAVAVIWRRRKQKPLSPSQSFIAIFVGASGIAGSLYWLSVPAFPDTYLRSDVPYLAASVVQGQQLFEEHCVVCHGAGGLGDGVEAAALPVPPADLSEPHTALHTAGDMYWWFTQGIPKSGMPAFGGQLSEQDRWDLVNFLRAFSRGFEARVLRDTIVPRDPWLGAPNFYFDGPQGYSELKALRETHTALLVFADYANPESLARLAALNREQPRLQQAGLQTLVIPIRPDLPQPPLSALQFVRNEAGPIWATYSLLSRSFADRGDDDALGVKRIHVEFLVDRFGYLRARWIPGESSGWADISRLLVQVNSLMAEPEIEPPPDDHVH